MDCFSSSWEWPFFGCFVPYQYDMIIITDALPRESIAISQLKLKFIVLGITVGIKHPKFLLNIPTDPNTAYYMRYKMGYIESVVAKFSCQNFLLPPHMTFTDQFDSLLISAVFQQKRRLDRTWRSSKSTQHVMLTMKKSKQLDEGKRLKYREIISYEITLKMCTRVWHTFIIFV